MVVTIIHTSIVILVNVSLLILSSRIPSPCHPEPQGGILLLNKDRVKDPSVTARSSFLTRLYQSHPCERPCVTLPTYIHVGVTFFGMTIREMTGLDDSSNHNARSAKVA